MGQLVYTGRELVGVLTSGVLGAEAAASLT
jgi:hypothetical protein